MLFDAQAINMITVVRETEVANDFTSEINYIENALKVEKCFLY